MPALNCPFAMMVNPSTIDPQATARRKLNTVRGMLKPSLAELSIRRCTDRAATRTVARVKAEELLRLVSTYCLIKVVHSGTAPSPGAIDGNNTAAIENCQRWRSGRGLGWMHRISGWSNLLSGAARGKAYHPAWSPDSQEVVYTDERVLDPRDRQVLPHRLWAVNIKTLEKRLITTIDVAQPQWSPNGYRMAYWASDEKTQRDIWTMSPTGDSAMRVKDDSATDWNPVWSSDGKYLYFVSDRTLSATARAECNCGASRL